MHYTKKYETSHVHIICKYSLTIRNLKLGTA